MILASLTDVVTDVCKEVTVDTYSDLSSAGVVTVEKG